jgi:hypothetical protein
MTVETHEDEARRVVMEITRRSVTVTAHLAQTTWLEVQQFVGQRLTGDRKEPRIGRRVTTTELEQSTRGQRESVNLSDPRTAKLVQKELNRYGVTFAITRDAEGTRVHIGAGNATQLDTAMRRAEQTLSRQLEAQQAREDRRAGRTAPTTEDVTADRSTTGPERRQVQTDKAPSQVADRVTAPAPDERYAVVVREALPAPLAQSVMTDNGWPALARSLAAVEEAGLDPAAVLGSVVRERETFTSRSVAAVLAWRVDGALQEAPPKVTQQPGEPMPGRAQTEARKPGEGRSGPVKGGGVEEVKDARTTARSALNERARALPKSEVKGDVVDLATEKPTRGMDLGGPRR